MAYLYALYMGLLLAFACGICKGALGLEKAQSCIESVAWRRWLYDII